ncbi:MAG: DUF3644 domain-containing protein [Flavobacteriales bacterium]|nr:DUF3644 domain-containing protein [Flavobacteriales bacterium]
MAIGPKQKQLYALFQEYATSGKVLTFQELLVRTEYKPNAAGPYISKGFWKRYLKEVARHEYTVHNMDGVSLEDFCASISQKRTDIELHELVTEEAFLVQQSRLEFQLAVELFNRPTTPNRVEAFLVHFCAAWEKLLKARVWKELGEEAIWTTGGEKKNTITLRKALGLLYRENDPVRLNLQEVNALRDESMHYLLNELAPIASRFFQAGVLNYFDAFLTFTGEPPIAMGGVGLLSLVFDAEEPSQAVLDQKYGSSKAQEIISHIESLSTKADELNDKHFAIPLRYAIGFVDKHQNPDFTIERLPAGSRVIIQTNTDPAKTHFLIPKAGCAAGERTDAQETERRSPDRALRCAQGDRVQHAGLSRHLRI